MHEVVVEAHRSMAWRPVVVGLVLSTLVVGAGALLRGVDPMAPPALAVVAVVAVVVLLMGCVRALLWLVRAGRTSVTVHGSEVTMVRGRRATVYRAADLCSVRILRGERRPELSRWALLPRVVVTFRDCHEVAAPILLTNERVSELDAALEDAVPRVV